jgi:photosystem II stability/assembly factor-like uncharacterized protein
MMHGRIGQGKALDVPPVRPCTVALAAGDSVRAGEPMRKGSVVREGTVARPPRFGRAVACLFIIAVLASLWPTPAVAGDGRWTTAGPEGGRVSALAIHPADARRMLAGTHAGGIFRTADAGAHWTRSHGLHRDASIWEIEHAPSEPEIVYAATDIGAYRSTDGGAHWTLIYSGATANSVTVDPTDADAAFITALLTVYRTDDGGATWDEIVGPHGIMGVDTIVFAPSAPGRVYAANHAELYVSGDSGLTWSPVSSLPHATDLAVHPTDADRLAIGTFSDGILRSTDAGVSWTSSNAGLPTGADGSVYLPVNAVSFNPLNGARLYAAISQRGWVYRYIASDARWQRRALGASYEPLALATSASDGYAVVVGTAHGGAYRSADDGLTWASANTGLVASEVEALLIRTGTIGSVLAGTGGQGIFRSTDGGRSWTPSGLAARRITALGASPRNPDVVYAGGDAGLWRSRDGGRSWSRVTTFRHRGVVALAVAPSDPRVIYVAQFESAWRSLDGGSTWARLNINENLASVEVHPWNPQRVYIGSRGGVYRSFDAGRTWHQSTGFILGRDVHDIAIDRGRPWLMYAATELDGVARSRDGGVTWTLSREGLAATWTRAVVVDPSSPDTVYVGTLALPSTGGVFVSSDRGQSWSPLNRGLTTTWIASLAISADGRRLYAGTTAHGLVGGGGAFAFTWD